MSPSVIYARIALFVVGINAVGMSAATAGIPRWPSWMQVVVDGQLALLVICGALASAPWYFRGSCLAVLPCLLFRPWPIGRDGEWIERQWHSAVALCILPHVLTALVLLCLLRELGLCIVAEGDAQPAVLTLRRFNLRRMFVWTTGVAALSLAWKRVIELQNQGLWGISGLSAWQLLSINMAASTAHAALDLMAVVVILGRSKLRFRLMWLLLFAAIVPAQAWRWALIVARRHDYWPVFEYDLFYLAPIAAVLLLARAAGYRLVWTAARDE